MLGPLMVLQIKLQQLSWTGPDQMVHLFTRIGSSPSQLLEFVKAKLGRWFTPSFFKSSILAQVHNRMFNFSNDGIPVWELEGKTLLKGETDGSSFPNGGLRATHTAGGYTVLDPSSPIFLHGFHATART